MKTLEILRTLRGKVDTATMTALLNQFRDEVGQTWNGIKNNKTTRAAAVKSYKGNTPKHLASKQDDANGLYCDGVSALSVSVKGAKYDDNNDIVKFFKEIFENKTRVDLKTSINYSIATAKCNGWRLGDTDHYIMVNGFYYNLSLVARGFNCIADSKMYNDCDVWQETTPGKKYKALLLSSKYGLYMVLPFAAPANKTYNVTPREGLFDEIWTENDDAICKAAKIA